MLSIYTMKYTQMSVKETYFVRDKYNNTESKKNKFCRHTFVCIYVEYSVQLLHILCRRRRLYRKVFWI